MPKIAVFSFATLPLFIQVMKNFGLCDFNFVTRYCICALYSHRLTFDLLHFPHTKSVILGRKFVIFFSTLPEREQISLRSFIKKISRKPQ
jgi:hypothetical protein